MSKFYLRGVPFLFLHNLSTSLGLNSGFGVPIEESIQAKLTSLQLSLKVLELEDKLEEALHYSENILLGKLLSPRKIRRFKVFEMASRVWFLKGKVETEKVKDNIYKFTFELAIDNHFV